MLFREHFTPTIPAEATELEVGGRRYGVIDVPEFASYPAVCSKNGGDERGSVVIKRGDLYVRGDAMNCEIAGPSEVHAIIDRSVERRGVLIRRMIGSDSSMSVPPTRPAAPPVERDSLKRFPALRALSLRPLEAPAPRRLRELEELLEKSRVTSGGGAYFPRYMNRVEADRMVVLRLPDRLIVEAEAKSFVNDRSILSVLQMTRGLTIDIRESLWEDIREGDQDRKRVGIVTMIGFVMAALLFADRVYRPDVPRFELTVGLIGALGMTLWLDSPDRVPFLFSPPTASVDEIWVTRTVSLDDIANIERRANVANDIIDEVFDYFGWQLTRSVYDELLNEARKNVALG
jgi:hypothetical protein